MIHIAIDRWHGNIKTSYCGKEPKDIFHSASSPGRDGTCLKCQDLYYQKHPNANAGSNPYFSAHNPQGNSELRKKQIKALELDCSPKESNKPPEAAQPTTKKKRSYRGANKAK